MDLSVLIPVYNEERTIREIVARVRATGLAREIVIVDNHSTDGTRAILAELDGEDGVRVILHDRTLGKGAALRTAIADSTGEVMVLQDADLEYDPADYPRLLERIEQGAPVVYGSRFLSGVPEGMAPRSVAANRLLTGVTNVLFGSRLTDMETCYKVFRRSAIEGIRLRAKWFEFEPELTAKLLKRGIPIVEVPVSFKPRTVVEGKKVGTLDGLAAIWTLLRYRFTD